MRRGGKTLSRRVSELLGLFGDGGDGGMEIQDIGGTILKLDKSSLPTFLNLTKSTSSKK